MFCISRIAASFEKLVFSPSLNLGRRYLQDVGYSDIEEENRRDILKDIMSIELLYRTFYNEQPVRIENSRHEGS